VVVVVVGMHQPLVEEASAPEIYVEADGDAEVGTVHEMLHRCGTRLGVTRDPNWEIYQTRDCVSQVQRRPRLSRSSARFSRR
jgi:hypothetical protein